MTMTSFATDFAPPVDAFAFDNNQWNISDAEAGAILSVFTDLAAGSLLARIPFLDGVLDSIMLTFGPLAPAAPQIERELKTILAGIKALDAVNPALCCGMCFSALDAFHAGVASVRGSTIPPISTQGKLAGATRKAIVNRHVDAWKAGAALTVLQWKLAQSKSGAGELAKRTASEVTNLLAGLAAGTPSPLVLVGKGNNPFDSHCVVAYAAEDTGSTDPKAPRIVTLRVYDPNQPSTNSAAPGLPPTWSSEIKLTVTYAATNDGGAITAIDLAGGDSYVGFFVANYSWKAPLEALGQQHVDVTITDGKQNIVFNFSYAGVGTIGPFDVGATGASVHRTGPTATPPKTHIPSAKPPKRLQMDGPPSQASTSETDNSGGVSYTLGAPSLLKNGAAIEKDITLTEQAHTHATKFSFDAISNLNVQPVAMFHWSPEVPRGGADALRVLRRIPGMGAFVGSTAPPKKGGLV